MDFHLDRNLQIPLAEQIRGQIKYAIAYGQLSSGEALPSVRQLANQLKVAPMTIARVYRELTEESLVVSRPRSGTYVAEMARINGNTNLADQNLRQMFTTSVKQAQLLGHSPEEIKNTFAAVMADVEGQTALSTVILVGNFRHTTEKYAQNVEEILRDLNIRVIPLILTDLKSHLPDYEETIRKARLTITVATRYNEVRALLEPNYSKVVAVAFSLSKETRRIIAELPPETCLGIITTYPEFLQPMLEGVHSYAILRNPPINAVLGQTDQIRAMFNEIDVLLYASGSESVLEFLPSHIRAIEFLHSPVPESLKRLRPYLV